MGLFKKKDANTDTPKTEKPAKTVTKTKQKSGLVGLIALLTGFILVAIAISTGVQFMNASQANQQYLSERQKLLGQTYLNQLNASLSNVQQATNQAASQKSLQLLVRVQDKQVIQSTEQRITATLPFAKKARIIPFGRAQLETHSEVPLTFAGLDMIKRLEKGQSVPLEFHRLKKKYYLQSVAPIKNDQGKMVASFFVTYDTYAVFNAFYEMDASQGELLIEQNFGNNSPTMLFVQGQGHKNKAHFKQATTIPHISLTYSNSKAQIEKPLINQNQTFIAGLIAILLVLVGMIIFHYVINSRLNKNMHMLSEFMHSVGSGRKPKMPHFTLGQFTTFAQSLAQQTRRSHVHHEESIIPDAFSNSVPAQPEEINDLHLDLDLDEESMTFEEVEDGTITQQIFRAYDIRGRVTDQLTPEAVELIGQAIGSEAYERGQQTIYVGYDGRLSSPELSSALIHGLKSTGRDVIDIGQVATPVVYFAAYTQESNTGIMITGSHNPPEYNGLKIVIDGEPLHEEGIQRLYHRIEDNDLLSGEGTYHKLNLDQEYIDRVVSDIAVAQPLTVVVDAGNGVAGQYAPQLFEAIGCDVIPLYCDVDGTFPNHHPDPTIESNLKDLIATVQGKHADLGIAFDGDGDRIVVVDNQGQSVQPDQLMMFFAKDVLNRCPGTDIVYDIKCSNKLGAFISQQGGRPVAWKSGHSLIKTKMLELGATFGGEMSGHLVFNERWYGFDDGLYAGARLLELLSTDNRSVSEIFQDYPIGLITPEYHIQTSDQAKFELVAKLKELLTSPAATITEIDGVRVDYDTGWGLVRASNTTPTLTLRFEGDDQDTLTMIMEQFKDAITQVDPALQIPF